MVTMPSHYNKGYPCFRVPTHSKTKNIDVHFHFLCDHYEKGDVDLRHVDTHQQLVDIFTKPLDQSTFHICEGNWVFDYLFDRGSPLCFYFSIMFFMYILVFLS
jgi:hypothetical protein